MDQSEKDPLTGEIIGAAIEVHRELGVGILESAYQECLCFELASRGLSIEREALLPVVYKTVKLDVGYRPDLIVENQVIVELKCLEKLIAIHDAQVLTYLRLSGLQRGLLINFQSQPLMNGVKRIVRKWMR